MTSTALVLILLAQAAPLRLAIESTQKVLRPGQKMPLRFTIENAGDKEGQVEEPSSYLEGLEIKDVDGKVVKAVGKTKGITKRSVMLEAGGFLGQGIDIAPAFPVVAEDKEGWYTLRWAYGEASSSELRVFVARDWTAKIETNHGTIEIEFCPQVAPNHVQNFLKLARSGFYEGSTFHRVIPGFMMQGGAPQDPSTDVKTPLMAEFSSMKHVFGTVSMARGASPNSATSQFFICFGAVPHLDGNYSIFAQVIGGPEVVKEIERVPSDHSPCKKCGRIAPRSGGSTPCCGSHHEDRPEHDVVIKKVTVSERKK